MTGRPRQSDESRQEPGNRHTGDWFVTSRHFTARPNSPRRPFGTKHLRRIGERRTACGRWAVEWPMYFDADMDARSDMCGVCAQRTGILDLWTF